MRAPVLGTALLLLFACAPAPLELMLAVDPQTRSVLAGVQADGEPTFAAGERAPGEALRLDLLPAYDGTGAQAWVLGYHQPLAELDLEPGPLPRASAGALDRGLPPYDEAHHAQLGDDPAPPWSALAAPDSALFGYRFRYRPPWTCIDRGGCFLPAGEGGGCVEPCPAPLPPDAPQVDDVDPAVQWPRVAPCPPGWLDAAGPRPGAPPVCRPWAQPPTCPMDQGALPSAGGCAQLLAPCPVGQWAEGLEPGAVHVRPGAVAGDGSSARPYGSLSEALALAGSGAQLALARGTYAEALRLDRPVRLRGACAAETHLSAHLLVPAQGVELSDLSLDDGVTITGSAALSRLRLGTLASTALAIGPGGAASGRSLLIQGGDSGVRAVGCRAVDLQQLSILDPSLFGVQASGAGCVLRVQDAAVLIQSASGAAARVIGGARLELERFVSEGALGEGVVAAGGAELRLSQVMLARGRVAPPSSAAALAVSGEAHAEAQVLYIVDPADRGATVSGAGSTLALTDTVILDTHGLSGDPGRGRALQVAAGAHATAERVWLHHTDCIGVELVNAAHLDARDLVVTEVLPVPGVSASGFGLTSYVDSTLVLERFYFAQTQDAALRIDGSRGEARLSWGSVVDTKVNAALGERGRAFHASGGALLELRAVRAVRGQGAVIYAAGDGTRVVASDLYAGFASSPSCGDVLCGGPDIQAGARASSGASVEVSRFLLQRNGTCGAQADEGSRLRLSDGLIAEQPVGAVVRSSLAPTRLIAERVLFQSNAMNIDSNERPAELVR